MSARSRDWITLLPLCKNVSALHFQFCCFFKRISLIALDIQLTEKVINKKLGLFFDGSLQGFSFCPPKICEPNRQTTWNTSHLHGIAWSSRKLDYDKLFAVFYDIKVMNAEMFASGLEKCRLLTRLLGQNVENLDDYGFPKLQDFVKTDSSWICSSYPFQHEKRLRCAERRVKVCGEWAMQHLSVFVGFFVFVFTTILIVPTRHDFFYNIQFEKLSLRNI